MNGETIIGYIMFGQTSLFNSHDELAKKVTDSLKGALTLDERSRLLLNNIKLKTEEELNSAAEILKSIANYIIIKNYLSQKKTYLMQEIQRYVLNNIDRPIKIPELCKTLLISKTKLYNVIKPEFKNGLTEYVLAVKTEKARAAFLPPKPFVKETGQTRRQRNQSSFSSTAASAAFFLTLSIPLRQLVLAL